MNKRHTLIMDIETSPMVAYVWGRRDQQIALNQVKSDWYVLAWAAKWLGDSPSKVIYADQRNATPRDNDKAILKPLWNLLDKADIVITQNGKNFDSPKLNARFILHGMNPPSPYRHLDTYQIVRSVAKFTSNGLDYLTEKLCTKYKKLKHKKFPGMSLWTECLAGNKAAWDEMRRYNIHDVLSTEELYTKLRAWVPQNAPDVYGVVDVAKECRTCGAVGEMRKEGFGFTRTGHFRRYLCKKCGSWQRGKTTN